VPGMNEKLDSLKSELQLAQNGSMARVPLYHQLYTVLKGAILDGRFADNSRMPTEHQLIDTFGVSRATARRAMDELAAEKLVARFRGKGSHVTYQYVPKPVRGPLVGMIESLIHMAEHDSVRVVSIKKVAPPADIRKILKLRAGQLVHKVVRVNSNKEGAPYAYYVSWTVGITKAFTKEKLESSARLRLLRDNNIKLTKMKQVIGVKEAPARVAAALQVERGTALLSVRRLGQVANGSVVDVLDALYNPKLYQYAMVMSVD